ncbi:MAG: anhydro-N-acetylmuramic acid kinase [Litorimonas sp.]
MSKTYRALGLMSGTSLDGVDAAIIETDGETVSAFGPSLTLPYTDEQRDILAAATQAALTWNFEGPPPNLFAEAEDALDPAHISAIRALGTEDVDVIGYHGQTVLHRPDKGRTLQLGTGARLARAFGVPCVHDFRTADVEAGGEGAPLAPAYHRALVEKAGLSGRIGVLNLGGVGNITLVDGPELLATDTGPANGPLDSWLDGVDTDGRISAVGHPDFERLNRWLARPFFERPVPKSADRYDFDVLGEMEDISRENGAATLTAFTALSTAKTLKQMGVKPELVLVCGGGRHNRTLMTLLSIELDCPVRAAETVGWDSDAIEAQAFAYLAVRTLRGLPSSFPTTTGVSGPVVGGRVARPI